MNQSPFSKSFLLQNMKKRSLHEWISTIVEKTLVLFMIMYKEFLQVQTLRFVPFLGFSFSYTKGFLQDFYVFDKSCPHCYF